MELCHKMLLFMALVLAFVALVAIVTRFVLALFRLKLHLAGDPGKERPLVAAVDFDEKEAYAGTGLWPAYERVSLPQTGGTLHLPSKTAKSRVAIVIVPGKGAIFNYFPLQGELQARGTDIDVVGVDFIGFGLGFGRNVRERMFPNLLSEHRLSDIVDTVAEAMDVVSPMYDKILLMANSTSGVACAASLDDGASPLERFPSLRGIWLTNPVIAWQPGHAMAAIVRSPLSSRLLWFLDRVLGLGPVPVQNDKSMSWLYHIGGSKENDFKASMHVPVRSLGVMVALPRVALRENTVRLQYLTELAIACRRFAARRRQLITIPSRSPPVYFSVNCEHDEPHCHGIAAAELLKTWGAEDAGNILTHDQFVYDTLDERKKVDEVLEKLIPQVLGVKWSGSTSVGHGIAHLRKLPSSRSPCSSPMRSSSLSSLCESLSHDLSFHA